MKETKKRTKKVFKKIAEIAGASLLGLYALSQADAYRSQGHFRDESPERKQFREQFGFPIYGVRDDIENRSDQLGVISDALQRSGEEQSFSLRKITISPEGFFKRTFPQQVVSLLSFDAHFNYLGNSIEFKSGKVTPEAAHHEIKHALTKKILRENPTFKSDWLALTKDERGKSMYRSLFSHQARKFGDFESLRTSYTQKEFAAGFASDYARTSFMEDVAELGAMVETGDPHHPVIEAEPNLSENSLLVKKLKLLQKVKLIPGEFMDYLQVQRKYVQCVAPSLPGLERASQPYVEFDAATRAFLDKYPHSRYAQNIKNQSAEFKDRPLVQK